MHAEIDHYYNIYMAVKIIFIIVPPFSVVQFHLLIF